MSRLKKYNASTGQWEYANAAGNTAEHISYDPDSIYSDGTVGKEIGTLSATIVDLQTDLTALGLSVVEGKLCVTYEEDNI